MSPPEDPHSAPDPLPVNPRALVHAQLVEALIHVLVEKGVLSKNDALSIVQSVAQVKRGELAGGEEQQVAAAEAELRLLERLYRSFDALTERASVAAVEEGNIRRLRPPIYDGRPEFPHDD